MFQNTIQTNKKISDLCQTPLRLLTQYSDNSNSQLTQQVNLNKQKKSEKYIPFLRDENKTYKYKFKASPQHRKSNMTAVQQYLNKNKTYWTENEIKTNLSIQRNLDKMDMKKQQLKIEEKSIKNYQDNQKQKDYYSKEIQILKDQINKLSQDNSNLFQDNKALMIYVDKVNYQKKNLIQENQKLKTKIEELKSIIQNQQKKSIALLNQKNQQIKQYNRLIVENQLLTSNVSRLTSQITALNNIRQRQQADYLNAIKQRDHMQVLLNAERAEKQCKIGQLEEIFRIVKKNDRRETSNNNEVQLQFALKKKDQQIYQLQRQIILLKDKKSEPTYEQKQKKDLLKQKDRIIYNLKIIHETQMEKMQQQLQRCQKQLQLLKIKIDLKQHDI